MLAAPASVVVPPEKLTIPDPAVAVNVPLPSPMPALMLVAPAAFKTRLRFSPPATLSLMLFGMLILRLAIRVSVRVAPMPLKSNAPLKLMSPLPPAAEAVVRVTSLVVSADLRVATGISDIAFAPVSWKVPAADAVFGVAPSIATMLMVVGSSRSVPVTPRGARVSTMPRKSSHVLPEVSTDPPSPPCAPPRALMVP